MSLFFIGFITIASLLLLVGFKSLAAGKTPDEGVDIIEGGELTSQGKVIHIAPITVNGVELPGATIDPGEYGSFDVYVDNDGPYIADPSYVHEAENTLLGKITTAPKEVLNPPGPRYL